MRAFVLTVVAACVLLTARTARSAVLLQVDFQAASGVLAPGFIEISNVQRWDQSKQLVLPDGISIGWTGPLDSGFRDRATADPLTRDLIDIASAKPAETFLIAGLPEGTYNLTLWAYDPSYPTKRTQFEIDGNDDGVADLFLKIENTAGEQSKAVQAGVSAAGKLAITVDGLVEGSTNHAGCFNGLALTPEPATLSLLAFGSLLLLRRRRH